MYRCSLLRKLSDSIFVNRVFHPGIRHLFTYKEMFRIFLNRAFVFLVMSFFPWTTQSLEEYWLTIDNTDSSPWLVLSLILRSWPHAFVDAVVMGIFYDILVN